jgi:hypothetical protein
MGLPYTRDQMTLDGMNEWMITSYTIGLTMVKSRKFCLLKKNCSPFGAILYQVEGLNRVEYWDKIYANLMPTEEWITFGRFCVHL